jgi:hypothetical protein
MDSLMQFQLVIIPVLVVIWLFVCGDGKPTAQTPEAKFRALVRYLLSAHLVFGPWAVCIFIYDSNHPEVWSDWYRNPRISLPCCLLVEVFIWAIVGCCWLRQTRLARGIFLLKEANRLLKEGQEQEAELAYQEGRRLLRMPPTK